MDCPAARPAEQVGLPAAAGGTTDPEPVYTSKNRFAFRPSLFGSTWTYQLRWLCRLWAASAKCIVKINPNLNTSTSFLLRTCRQHWAGRQSDCCCAQELCRLQVTTASSIYFIGNLSLQFPESWNVVSYREIRSISYFLILLSSRYAFSSSRRNFGSLSLSASRPDRSGRKVQISNGRPILTDDALSIAL